MDTIKSFENLSFRQAMWLLPISLIIHVSEEFPRFVPWATKFIDKSYTQSWFIVENIVLFVIVILSVLTAKYSRGKIGIILVLSAAVGFFVNMIFHASLTLSTGVYSPGTVTACLFFTSIPIYVYYLAKKENLLTITTVVSSIILGIIVMPIVLNIVHRIA